MAVFGKVLSRKKSVLSLSGKFSFIVLGSLLIVISAFYISSFLAILGTSLIFWGAVLFYITPTKHVPLTLLNSVANSDSKNIQRILVEFNTTEKGIYLLPENLNTAESSLVFVPRNSSSTLPLLNNNIAEKLTCKDADGLLINPPGFDLSKLFEEESGTPFMKMTLQNLRENLPKIMVENLEIAESVELNNSDKLVTIRIKSVVATRICEQAKDLQRFHNQIGCLFPSTLACVLTRVVGKPIIIQNEITDQESETIEIEYRILEGKDVGIPTSRSTTTYRAPKC